MTRVLPFLLAIILCAQPNSAHAKTTQDTPTTMQGVWSSPDCADSQKTWIISKYFFIQADAASLSTGRSGTWRQEDNGGDTLYSFSPPGMPPALLNRTNDGLMKIIRSDTVPEGALKDSWGWAQNEVADEYSRCVKLFDTTPHLGQEEVNSIFLLDRIIDDAPDNACHAVTAENFAQHTACQKHLFAIADSNSDRKIDRAELERIERQIRFLNRAAAQTPDCETAPTAHLLTKTLLSSGVEALDFDALRETLPRHTALWIELSPALSRLVPFLPRTTGCVR